MRAVEHSWTSAAAGRLVPFLRAQLPEWKRSTIEQRLAEGYVQLNGAVCTKNAAIGAGDTVQLTARPGALPSSNPSGGLRILHEDALLVAVDKPAGLLSVAANGERERTALALLRAHIVAQDPECRLWPVHRLDRETSGVLLLAKKRSALRRLHDELRDGATDKHYLALVDGRWRDDKRAVKAPLLKYVTAEGERRVSVSKDGQPSETVFRLLRRWPQACLLDCELLTGRTHQIRAHLAHTGHPVAHDDKYGDYGWNHELTRMGLKRMFLHAARMRFTHPASGEPMTVEAPLPPALAGFVERLDALAARPAEA